jgi:hypothetical protein
MTVLGTRLKGEAEGLGEKGGVEEKTCRGREVERRGERENRGLRWSGSDEKGLGRGR